MRQKKLTITDIARLAEVSPATVSRVLNGVDYPVREELRNRILQISEEHHYTPNFFGKMLKQGKSNDIGVVVPSIINPFYSETIAGIEKECRENGYNPIFCNSDDKPEKEKEYIDLLMRKSVDGMLVSTISDDDSFLRTLIDEHAKIVLFDQPAENLLCDKITFDFYEAGLMATHFLLQKGHRDIAFMSSSFDRKSRFARYDGFREALKTESVAFNEKARLFLGRVEEDESDGYVNEFENGRRLSRKFLATKCPATAIIAINDILALGVIHELMRNGCRVPEDVSVIGFDDISFSMMVYPPLTTVKQPSFEMGALAAKLLIDKLNEKVITRSQVVLRPSIVERDSVCSL